MPLAKHGMTASSGVFSPWGLLKRLSLVALQLILDILLYWGCLAFVLSFWGKDATGFTTEVRLFFVGVLLVVFYFNALYDFRNWLFWDEMRAVLQIGRAHV